tara:strand:- start:551 stop:1147 length:597 start_codon:yes stop_codon:yes gene_type:complete
MKKFFIQDDVSTAKTSSVIFLISGVIAFIQPDILVVRTLASFFGAVAIAQIVLLGPQIMEDSIPESWRTANAMIAAVILLDNLIDTGYVAREIENPIAREPIFIFLNFAFLGYAFTTEGKMTNIYRYMIMFGASAFILVLGAEFFFGVEIPESLDIIFLPVFFTWLIGITQELTQLLVINKKRKETKYNESIFYTTDR